MARTRSRSTPYSREQRVRTTKYILRPGSGYTKPADPPPVVTNFLGGMKTSHVITDKGGPFVQGSVNPCTHTVDELRSFPISIQYPEVLYGWNGFLYTSTKVDNLHVASASSRTDLFYGLSALDSSTWFNRGVSNTLEQVPVAVSLPNFLLEIDEIPKLIGSAQKLRYLGFKDLKSLKLGLGTRGGRKQLVEKFSGVWADSHLAYQFGVKPLISDVASLIGITERVQKRIAYLKRTRGKPTKIKRSKTFSLSPNPFAAYTTWHNSESYGVSESGMQVRWVPLQASTTLSMGLTFVHNLDRLDELDAQFVALSAAAGFNRPLSVLWEAIPFSFVLDYFGSFGDRMAEYQSYTPFEGTITGLSGWSSTKTVQSSVLEYKCGGGVNQTGIACSSNLKSFVRSVGIPTNQGLKFDTHLSASESTNIIALVRQAL